jgi:O-antigen ligase
MAGMAAYPFLVMRYGIRGILDWTKPWRFLVLMVVVFLSLLGGFRSALVIFALLFIIQFWNEGLLRSRMAPLLITAGVLMFAGLIPLAQKLPLSVQRSLSVLPLPVNPAARADAKGSTEWRVKMWQALAPEIPQHYWLGKGYTASAADYYLAQESVRRGLSSDHELTILSGDYHNGPLSILIPFGIWGVLAFLAFTIAALRVLYLNHRDGDPALQRINTFLFSYFIAKLVFFFTVFGALHIDIATFLGVVGLSISLNGGVVRERRRSAAPWATLIDESKPSPINPVPAFQSLRRSF